MTNMQEYKRNLNMTTPERKFNKENNSTSYTNSSNVSQISSPKKNIGITRQVLLLLNQLVMKNG
jgi:hypothetical protein